MGKRKAKLIGGKYINGWKAHRRARMPRSFVRPEDRIDITDLFSTQPLFASGIPCPAVFEPLIHSPKGKS